MRAVVVLLQQHAYRRAEFIHLVESAGYSIFYTTWTNVRNINAATYVGSGFICYLQSLIESHKPDTVLFSDALSARHTRNIQKALCLDIQDRTELILHIFKQRAQSFEGKLQVELADLNYMSTKLVRGWTHLERQRGGIGLRGGPGETQIEVDRRILRDKITNAKKKLKKLQKTRTLNRQSRLHNKVFNIALVGYTNAGKSSLFNILANSTVDSVDKLFVTLDPKTRVIDTFSTKSLSVTITDTVGFIEDLPGPLLEAFASTLEEVAYADLLLHVVDAADKDKVFKMQTVQTMIEKIGAEHVPLWTVHNKIDELNSDLSSQSTLNDHWISAHNHLGIDYLKASIETILPSDT